MTYIILGDEQIINSRHPMEVIDMKIKKKGLYLRVQLIIKESYSNNIKNICEIVREYYNIPIADFYSKWRKREVVKSRQIAMYYCRELCKKSSLQSIGDVVGKKDHATVLHAVKVVANDCKTDKLYKKEVEEIRRILIDKLYFEEEIYKNKKGVSQAT